MKIDAVDYVAFRNSSWELFKKNGWALVAIFLLSQVLSGVVDVVRNALTAPLVSSLETYSENPQGFFSILGGGGTEVWGVVGLVFFLFLSAILFGSFIQFGFMHLISEYVQNKKLEVSGLFYGLKDPKHWFRLVGVTILMAIAVYTLAIIGFVIAYIIIAGMGVQSGALIIAFVCLIAAIFFYAAIHLVISWYFATLAVVIDRKMPIEALKYSAHLVRDNRTQVVRIMLQTIGWTIVGLLCLGVGLLVAVPFVMILATKYYLAFRDHDVASAK